MKKNFLLLFLLTLLPLAGWAQDYVEVTITPFDQSATWCNEKPTVTKAWFQSPGATNPALKDAIATLLEVQDLEGDYNVGEYTYRLKLKNGAENTVYQYEEGIRTTETAGIGDLVKVYTIFTSSATAVLNITKYETPADINLNQLAYVGTPLKYTGEAQDLLTIGEGSAPTATTLGGDLIVPVVYALDENAETWVTDYATLTGTEAGTYHVWYKVADTDNYQGTDPEKLTVDGKEIATEVVDFTNIISAVVAPATTLTYDGSDQQLLTLANDENPLVNFGAAELLYRINSDNDEDWAALTTLTAITGKNAGVYAIDLKVPATANYDDGTGTDATETINVTIGRAEVDEEIAVVALADAEATFTYKGAAWEPELAVTYGIDALSAEDGDIAIAYANNINAGEATATVTFNNYYKDDADVAYTKDLNFNIAKKSLADEDVTASVISTQLNQTYKGSAFTGSTFAYANLNVYVGDTKLTSASYDRSYQNNINVGSMDDPDETKRPAVIITGKGNYTGTTKAYFNINPRSLEDANIAIDDALETAQTYTGSQITPSTEGLITYSTPDPDYTLLEGEDKDYTVTYGENVSGTGTITITGTGNFTGEVTKEFAIGNAAAYIVPVAKSKLYGAVEPTLTWKVVDAEGTELGNDVLKGDVVLDRQEGQDVGTYLIYVVSYEANAADNYTVANVFGVEGTKTAPFTIFANTENTLVLKFKDDLDDAKKTKDYDGTTAVAFEATDFEAVSGLLNDDTWEAIGAGATITAELSGSDAGEVTATASINGLANYPYIQVQNSPLNFTITPLAITITAKAQTIVQGGALDQSEYEVSDDVTAYGDTNDDLNIVLTATKSAVGEWEDAIEVSAENANYDFTFVPGDLEITAADGITLGGDNDLQTIKDYADQNVNVTIDFTPRNERAATWKADTWVTMTLPFNITVGELSKKLGYAVVNEIDPSRTEIDGTSSKFYGKLTMKGAYTKEYLPANKPFMVKIADNIADVNNGIINFGPQDIVAPADDDDLVVQAGGGVKFTGTYTTKTVTSADNQATWFMTGSNSKWLYIGSQGSWDILPCEGFLDLSGLTEAQARNMTFVFEEIDGSKTAIKGISTDDLNNKNAEGWYNLKGMKMDGAPLQKGIYIKDGKKVVIK